MSGEIRRTDEARDQQLALAPDFDGEAARERRWWEFELEVRNFAASEPDGYAAVLRAVARAMTDA